MTTSDAGLPPSDPTAARDLARHLGPDETLLWSGRPDERHYCRTDPRLLGLGVFWVLVAGAGFYGFTITLLSDEYDGVSLGARILLLLLAATPFIAVAVICLGGHVAILRRQRLRCAYAITTARVLALRPALRFAGQLRLDELPLAGIGDIRVETVRRASGSIEFHDARGVADPVAFDTVSGAEALAEMVRRQRAPST